MITTENVYIYLQRVHRRQLQRLAVAHVRLQHRLVPLQGGLLGLGHGLVALAPHGGPRRLGDVSDDHLKVGCNSLLPGGHLNLLHVQS